jgi:hypothetical protein
MSGNVSNGVLNNDHNTATNHFLTNNFNFRLKLLLWTISFSVSQNDETLQFVSFSIIHLYVL